MNLSLALSVIGCLLPSVTGFSQTLVDQYNFNGPQTFVGNSMWLFSSDGVHIYSPDGSEQRAHLTSRQICEDPATFTGPSYKYCRFSDVVSDGKKYVWAATSRDDTTVTVFDIDTGALVGSFKSCLKPDALEYHPLRDEVWVRCEDVDENSSDPTHLDVISASNPNGEVQTNIMMGERALKEHLSSSGSSVIHPSLGDIAYLTDDSNPKLFEIDLSTKDVIGTVDILPAAHGLSGVAFSPVNNHVFVRAVNCCTCGTVGSDLESCGRYAGYPVSPTTGKQAGMTNVTGLCGRSCAALEGVDTVGVYEFDTDSKTVVATHTLADGIGGDPYPSPDGNYIVMLARNGGKTVRVLQAGVAGAPSSVLVDLELDFNRTGYETTSVARDFAFVERNGKTMLVMPSGTSHKVAIVDFTDNFATTYVTFTDKEFYNTAPHGRYRGVEWAVGTDFVWTNDSSEDEHYVIDVMQGKLVKTITGIERSSMLSVQNYERAREAAQQEKLIESMKIMQKQVAAGAMKEIDMEAMQKQVAADVMEAMKKQAGTNSAKEINNVEQQSSINLNAAPLPDEEPTSMIAIAIVVASLALVVGIVNLFYMNSMNNDMKTKYNQSTYKEPIISDPRDDKLGVST